VKRETGRRRQLGALEGIKKDKIFFSLLKEE